MLSYSGPKLRTHRAKGLFHCLLRGALAGVSSLGIAVCLSQTKMSVPKAPTDLRIELLRAPHQVYKGGIPVETPLQSLDKRSVDSLQFPAITNTNPAFSWVLDSCIQRQEAYQIILSGPDSAPGGAIEIWNSGRIRSSRSTGVRYQGTPLKPSTVYSWKVRVWASGAQPVVSKYSTPQYFKTADRLQPDSLPDFVLTKTWQEATHAKQINADYLLYDFTKDGFAQPVITLTSLQPDTINILLGEKLLSGSEGMIDQRPPGTVRFRKIRLAVKKGRHRYQVPLQADPRNTKPAAVKMPHYIGEVVPFRYLALQGNLKGLSDIQVGRHLVHIPFKMDATIFNSSDSILNQVWELCKYTIEATSFAGYYVDGDRERIPYEADALINQLSHYSVEASYNMAKRTLNYLIYHPTWPTEWSLQNPLIAYYDYMYSGDIRSLNRIYEDLKRKVLDSLEGDNHLISTRTGKQVPAFLKSIHYQTFDGNEGLKDIVDWPHTKQETDGFVFKDYNAVVNAFYYGALCSMAKIAKAMGKTTDYTYYRRKAATVKAAFTEHFIDPGSGIIRDGIGTAHSSLHANMFALAFDLVPEQYTDQVLKFIKSRGVACSVYGAQFLLEALGKADHSDYALHLITDTTRRSWMNMIREGATMTMEAWGQDFKPNQDWNHAWGTAPANYIVRYLMGIQPLDPGFNRILIRPRPWDLRSASIRYATLKGDIQLSFQNGESAFEMDLSLPGNTSATVMLPCLGLENPIVKMDGHPVKVRLVGQYLQTEAVGAGKHHFSVR